MTRLLRPRHGVTPDSRANLAAEDMVRAFQVLAAQQDADFQPAFTLAAVLLRGRSGWTAPQRWRSTDGPGRLAVCCRPRVLSRRGGVDRGGAAVIRDHATWLSPYHTEPPNGRQLRPTRWDAKCACGWISEGHPTMDKAAAASRQHLTAIPRGAA